jgi:hypothetical protein
MLTGHFICHEGIPAHFIVKYEDGKLKCTMDGAERVLRHCEKVIFAVYSPEDPENRLGTYRFYLRDGKAWGVKCGSRIYQRADEA